MASWNCRVCGLEYTFDDPNDLPWGADGRTPDYTFCDCCGVEFGYGDFTVVGARRWRSRWLEGGARWEDPKMTPSDWNLERQLDAVPSEFR